MKLKASDNLAHVKKQLTDLVEPHSKVIELGCGNGDLLFRLAPKIHSGVGIDYSKELIAQARHTKTTNVISNLTFQCQKLDNKFTTSEKHHFSIASLFFHVIPVDDAIYLIEKMIDVSDTVLICGFCRPKTLQQKFLLYLDQRFSGHYKNFSAYQKAGYMEGILKKTKCHQITVYNTHIPFLKIYRINSGVMIQ